MNALNRRQFMKTVSLLPAFFACSKLSPRKPRPNMLLLMSDNQSWNHLGCYGNPVVKTPNIDSIARQGVRFTHAFCQAPSCTPARAGMLSGQDIWRLEEGANMWGILPQKFPVFTDLLSNAGYFVGCQGKAWGPGNVEASGRSQNPGGKKYDAFETFLNEKPAGQPWFFWISYREPHRPYHLGSGKAAAIDLERIKVPAYLPDNNAVRGDIADYYLSIQKMDGKVGQAINTLKRRDQLDNTLIVFCADNGWQMPRGLANLYDFGTRIPLVISWKGHIALGRVVEDFVNMNDFAPTFLEIAGIRPMQQMTAESFKPLLFSKKSGEISGNRKQVFLAWERHAFCRKNGLGYPGRAIRTYRYLYIRNYQPDRWPAGDPPLFGDVDAHMLHYPCPTKMYLLGNRDNPAVKQLFTLAFGKRPREELFDLKKDPDQMKNVADDAGYAEIKQELSARLTDYLQKTGDPRETGGKIIWDTAKYFNERDKKPRPSREAIELLGLKEEYNYLQPGENFQKIKPKGEKRP